LSLPKPIKIITTIIIISTTMTTTTTTITANRGAYADFLRTIRDAQIWYGNNTGGVPHFAPYLSDAWNDVRVPGHQADPAWAAGYAMLVEYHFQVRGQN
jgi:hypothetical protein